MKYYELIDGTNDCTDVQEPGWDYQYDILVAGAGSAGIYAAMAAAEDGRRVLLLEKSKWCGGMHVQGLVNGYYYGFRKGLFTHTDEKSSQLADEVFCDVTDAKRLVIAEELAQKGIESCTSSMILGLYACHNKIIGAKVCMENRIVTVKSRMLIDATSDGHVLRMLPVKTHRGREIDHEVQPFSSVRCVCLDLAEYDGGIRVPAGRVSGKYGVFHEYRDNGYVNQYDEEAYSRAVIRAHASHLRTLSPSARFLYLAPLIGVREGVLYEGEQYVTLEEVLTGKNRPENVLLYAFSDIDKHGSDMAFDDKIYQDWFVNSNMSTCTVYIPIPVGSVVPKGFKGFITSGRCLSMDSYTNSAVRMNTDSFRIGEACGCLASMAVDYEQDAMSIPYEDLKRKLEERSILEDVDLRPSFWTPARADDRRYVEWMTDEAKIREALSTNKPAVALWSCRLLGKGRMSDAVYEMTKTEDEMLRYNAGIALGLMQDERALPILREIIVNRRPFYYMDCRRSNQMRSVIAIALCGQVGDVEIKDELLAILKPEEFEKPMYHELLEPRYELSIVKEQNSVYFQHFSHAAAALVRIAEKHEECREEIKAALHAALDDDAYIRRITQEPEYNAYYQAACNCRRFFRKRLEDHDLLSGQEVDI